MVAVSFLQTGTLTQNVMTFLKCSIQGVRYGDISPNPTEEVNVATGEVMEGEDKLEDKEKVEPVDFSSWNRYADKDFVYYDSDFVEKSRSGEQVMIVHSKHIFLHYFSPFYFF